MSEEAKGQEGPLPDDPVARYSDEVMKHLDRQVVFSSLAGGPPASVGQPRIDAEAPGRPSAPQSATEPLEAEIGRLARVVAERDAALLDVKTELKIAQSTIKVQEAEIKLLTDVIARDRTRVQAETAHAAQQIAAATVPLKRNGNYEA